MPRPADTREPSVTNPILIELTRGALVESRHAGAVCVARADGTILASAGDIARPVFPRSAIKPLQAVPLLETGADARFGFGAPEIAIACGSHSGTPRHVEVVAGMLARARLTPADLGCGTHEPMDAASARDLVRAGASPSSLHHNCSGKHAGMLATAVHRGEPVAHYWRPDHPVQVRIARVLEEMTGSRLGADVCGIDGCSVPNWAIPLAALAAAFAGPGRLDTLLMQRLPGRVLVKAGAEGVYAGALVEQGLGFALKIDDGAKRAAETVAVQLTARFHPEASDVGPAPTLRNWRGLEVGRMRPSSALAEMLRRL
jgi:L-asparaginase II